MKARNYSAKSSASARAPRDLFQEITDRILALLDAGVVPWRKQWSVCRDTPRNWNGRPYHGINFFLLINSGFSTPVFLTFNKAKALGGQVRKGEKGSMVVFWKFFENSKGEIDQKTGKPKLIPMLRHYTVFNVDQCDGLPSVPHTKLLRQFNSIEEAERIIAGMPSRPPIAEDGRGRAYYSPATDSVHMPVKGSFKTDADWYATLLHELSHSSGHQSRLARDLSGKFGTPAYAREELVAELSAAFLCAAAGIDSAPLLENTAAYIASWKQKLTDDAKAFVWAAGKAQHAATFIHPALADYSTGEAEAGQQAVA